MDRCPVCNGQLAFAIRPVQVGDLETHLTPESYHTHELCIDKLGRDNRALREALGGLA